jgi:hypothetical protein
MRLILFHFFLILFFAAVEENQQNAFIFAKANISQFHRWNPITILRNIFFIFFQNRKIMFFKI